MTRDDMPPVPTGKVRLMEYRDISDRSLLADKTAIASATAAVHSYPTATLAIQLETQTMTERQQEQAAYVAGWHCTMAGYDPRYHNPYDNKTQQALAYAWTAGALDAFEAEDGEEPEPECAGF